MASYIRRRKFLATLGGTAAWPPVAREIVTAEKPKFVVMMIGNNDRSKSPIARSSGGEQNR